MSDFGLSNGSLGAATVAADVTYTPADGLASADVQAALGEVWLGSARVSHPHDYARTGISTIAAGGAAQSIDVSDLADVDITLTANCTITMTGWPNRSHDVVFTVRQDATGGWTPTFTGVNWGGEEPAWDLAPNAVTLVVLRRLGTAGTVLGLHSGSGIKAVACSWVGNFAVSTAAPRWPLRRPVRLLGFELTADVSPTGAAWVVNVVYGNSGGEIASLFPNTGAMPTVAAGGHDSGVNTSHNVAIVPAGSWIKAKTQQVGSTITGAHGTLVVYFVGDV